MARPRTMTDEAILAATGRAISRRGVPGLTLSSVADEAGLAPATLVQRFGSKRGLLLAFAKQAPAASRRAFVEARQGAPSPLAALHDALARLAAGVQSPEALANSLSFLALDISEPEFRQHAAAQVRAVRTEVAEQLTEAEAAGELAPGTDAQRLTDAVQIAYNGVLVLWGLSGTNALAEAIRDGVGQVLEPYLTEQFAGRSPHD